MKARNTKTGEVVDNFGFSKEYGTVSYTDKNGILTFSNAASGEWEIIDDQDGSVDWQSFRREAAKDILVGMMTQISPCDYGISHAEVMATYAVLYANKLIDELKEDKK